MSVYIYATIPTLFTSFIGISLMQSQYDEQIIMVVTCKLCNYIAADNQVFKEKIIILST